MGDMRAGTRCHQRGKAGIAEEIEQAHRAASRREILSSMKRQCVDCSGNTPT